MLFGRDSANPLVSQRQQCLIRCAKDETVAIYPTDVIIKSGSLI